MATLKRIEKIVRENAFDEKKKKPGSKFNPVLALIGLRITRPRNIIPLVASRRDQNEKFLVVRDSTHKRYVSRNCSEKCVLSDYSHYSCTIGSDWSETAVSAYINCS